MTMKNAVFWDVTSCGSCKSRRVGGTDPVHRQGDNQELARRVLQFLVAANVAPNFLIHSNDDGGDTSFRSVSF
jgi:hypothetical protein